MGNERLDELVRIILGLSVPELAELNRRLRDAGEGGLGVREPRRPKPPASPTLADADSEDRSVRGRTL